MPLLPSTSSQATSGTTLQVRLATTVEVTTRQHSLKGSTRLATTDCRLATKLINTLHSLLGILD